ncbi:hypothetical protein N2152v2_009037 [Parachlorella kessleri]
MLRMTAASFRRLQVLRQTPGIRLASSQGKSGYEDIQDPNVTQHSKYRNQERHVPSEAEVGSEKEVKMGVNMPSSAGQLAEELKSAGQGLAQSVSAGVSAVANKGKDVVQDAKRSVGMETSKKAMSLEDMGGAGKMEYAPAGVTDNTGPEGHPREKYDELKASEAAHFPEGERSVTEQWRAAGSYQNSPEAAAKVAASPEQQRAANEEIRRDMRKEGAGGSSALDESREDASGLSDNLHNRGP